MAYNILAESSGKICWEKLNEYVRRFSFVECVPMPKAGINGGDAVGFSVPEKNIGMNAYREIEQISEILQKNFGCTLYNMYYGTVVDKEALKHIKQDIT